MANQKAEHPLVCGLTVMFSEEEKDRLAELRSLARCEVAK